MQGNPELKGMNDLIIWKTIGSETITNRAQKVASLEVLPTFLAITRTTNFSVPFVRDVCLYAKCECTYRQDDHQLFIPKDFFPEYFPQPKPLSSQFQMSPFQFENLPKWISAISQYNLRETNSVAISCRTKDSFRTFRRGDQSSATDHIVGTIEKLIAK